MGWEVEFTDEFEFWWLRLSEMEQIKIAAAVRLLEEYGPDLSYPLSSAVRGSRHPQMRELRVQTQGRPFRILYAFNPKRVAILLVGGDKTGDGRWYEVNVRKADKLYDLHLRQLKKEGSRNG